ncbi:MAG: zinc ribbon domain-containing protein [SAR202 cluster bacterium]|nr:zinc ribbon domain-containing protein [SAR202 cluster bacterium]
MPTYVYECSDCSHRFELKQSFQSETVAPCPICKNKSERVILSVPVVFKGSGWYVNDYGKGSPNPPKTESSTKEKKDSANTKTEKPKSTNKSTSKKEKPGNKDN